MSVAVCKSSSAGFESILDLSAATISAPSSRTWLQAPAENEHEYEKQQLDQITKSQEKEEEYVYVNNDQEAERPPGQFDIWSSFQAQKAKQEGPRADEPYVHPLMRRSSSLLSQKSLEICTESLGSETGSYEFFSSDDETDFFSLGTKKEQVQLQQEQDERADEEEDEEFEHVAKRNISNGAANGKKELTTVNYHCSISRRSPQPRSFPPPLPSISRRDGPCLQMRPHRRDGRLVVEAVAVPSQNYLHAERQNGRLLLSFINTTSSYTAPDTSSAAEPARQTQAQLEKEEAIDALKEEAQVQGEELEDEEVTMEVEADEEEEEEEEEVEVVDRGTVVEVKVSTNPQQNSSGAAKVHRSSIVINKFVSMPDDDQTNNNSNEIFTATAAAPPLSPVRRLSTTTTTAAAAAVAASSLSSFSAADGSHSSTTDNKLLFTSRRRNREELLHAMRRCNQLRKPLFIWERCCIATSS